MKEISAYEMEKADEMIAEDEKQFMISILFYLPTILVSLLFNKIKELIK